MGIISTVSSDALPAHKKRPLLHIARGAPDGTARPRGSGHHLSRSLPQIHMVSGRLHQGKECWREKVAGATGIPRCHTERPRAGSWRPLHDSLRPVRHQLPRHFCPQDHEPPGRPWRYAQGERGSTSAPSHADPWSVGLGNDWDSRVRRGGTQLSYSFMCMQYLKRIFVILYFSGNWNRILSRDLSRPSCRSLSTTPCVPWTTSCRLTRGRAHTSLSSTLGRHQTPIR